MAYLSGVGRLSKRTIRTLFADLCDLPVSLGAVSKLEAMVSRALAPIHTAAQPDCRPNHDGRSAEKVRADCGSQSQIQRGKRLSGA